VSTCRLEADDCTLLLPVWRFGENAGAVQGCRAPAVSAARARHWHSGGGLFILENMLLPDIGRGKDRNKWRRERPLLPARTASRLLPLHQPHLAPHFKTKFARRLNRLDGRRTRGANVIHDHYPRPFFLVTFDPPPGTVLLLRFADQKSIHVAAGHAD